MAKIYRGAALIADNVPEPAWSIHGVHKALAERISRAEYRRVYRGPGAVVTGQCGATFALIETRNPDGSLGQTYSIHSEGISK